MKFITPIVFLSLVLSFSFCSKKSTTESTVLSIEDMLVKNNEITGWSYFGNGWVANNISELTTYINGKAETYQKHGFVEGAQQSYRGTIDNVTHQINLTVYKLNSESNAKATYEDPDIGLSGTIDWTGGAGSAAHYSRYGLSQVMTFYRGTNFVYLDVNYDTEESLNILKQFALNVDGKIK